MLLSTKDGIRCDLTAEEFRERFEYYSAEFTKVIIGEGPKREEGIDLDIEISLAGYDYLFNRCKQWLADAKKNSIKCDLCNRYYSGQFNYWKVAFAHVTVDKDADPATTVDKVNFDLNVGEVCFEELKKRVDKSRSLPEKKKSDWSME